MSYFFKKILKDESGQSLVEILVALTIGALLIGAASAAVVTMLQSGTTSQRHQSATILTQDYLEKVRTYASSDWHNIYNLSKGSSTLYHFEASSTAVIAVQGKEGVIDNDIRGNLAGYWALDEASSTIVHDKSGNGNNGNINGATATSTDCKVGRCFNFDGASDYISVTDDSSLDMVDGEGFSVAAWIRSDTANSWQDIAGKGGWDSPPVYLLQKTNSNLARFGIHDGTNQLIVDSSLSLSTGTWYHIVGVFDGTDRGELYINGDLEATSTQALGSLSNSSEAWIGKQVGRTQYFDGKIDDVRIYDKTLTADDVEHLHNSAIFNRYFYVEDVCRTNDANYEISGVKPCDPGEKEDPSTQKVTVVVKWGNNGEFILDDYITRWKNRVFPQDSWSGGPGFDGPVTEPTDKYSTSTDISTSTGGLKIEGI